MFPDPRNMGVAVGISLLSCIRAEIYVISYLLPPSLIYDIPRHRTASLFFYCVFDGTENV